MLELTFLGWQSWLVRSRSGSVLVDPLLSDSMGRGPPHTQLRHHFYPPRRFDLRPDACPRLDAVLITHEHEDHFHIPSLARIDRSVPVILSARSSVAARTLVREMGFELRLGDPGARFELGDLSLALFTPIETQDSGDEIDTLAYLFTSASRRESLFSNVDVMVTEAMASAVSALPGTVLCYEMMTLGLREVFESVAAQPSAMHRAPNDVIAPGAEQALALLQSGQRIRPTAGQTFVLEDGRIREVRPRCDFLSIGEAERPRGGYARAPGEPVNPVVEPRELEDDEIAEIEQGLEQIAQFLFDSKLRRRLYSLSVDQLGERTPTFVWLLQTDQDTFLPYEYQPQACAFAPLDELSPSPTDAYVGVVMSWAIDLLHLVRGQFEPRCIVKSIAETWHASMGKTSFFMDVLWMFFHPLRHPARCLARYREQLAEHADTDVAFLRR